jgi:hypothetical protein
VKKFFVIFIAILAITVFAAAVCTADELVKNPTCKDFAGQWEGTFNTGGKSVASTGDISMTCTCEKNGKISFSTSRTTGKYGKVSIDGSKLTATRPAREDVLQLYKKSDGTMIIKAEYTRSGGSKMGHASAGGTYKLEKKK